jgi:hypothetical protein
MTSVALRLLSQIVSTNMEEVNFVGSPFSIDHSEEFWPGLASVLEEPPFVNLNRVQFCCSTVIYKFESYVQSAGIVIMTR